MYVSALGERIRRPKLRQPTRKPSARIFLKDAKEDANAAALRSLDRELATYNLSTDQIRNLKTDASRLSNLRYMNMKSLAATLMLRQELRISDEDLYNLLFDPDYIMIWETYLQDSNPGEYSDIIELYQRIQAGLKKWIQKPKGDGGADSEHSATLLRYLRALTPRRVDVAGIEYQVEPEMVG